MIVLDASSDSAVFTGCELIFIFSKMVKPLKILSFQDNLGISKIKTCFYSLYDLTLALNISYCLIFIVYLHPYAQCQWCIALHNPLSKLKD